MEWKRAVPSPANKVPSNAIRVMSIAMGKLSIARRVMSMEVGEMSMALSMLPLMSFSQSNNFDLSRKMFSQLFQSGRRLVFKPTTLLEKPDSDKAMRVRSLMMTRFNCSTHFLCNMAE